MRLSTAFATLTLAASALAAVVDVPRNVQEFREKHPVAKRKPSCRKTFVPRSSKDDLDDVADEFLDAIKQANNGGTVYLPEGETFIIGKPLDLTFLNDIHVRLEGTIRFTNDVPFWQKNAFYHPFQRSLMFWKWGGKDIKIYGEGTLDGQGQRWWNEFSGADNRILDPDNAYLRPILFYAEHAENLHVEGILMKDSPVWHNFIVESKYITYRDVIVEAKSNNATVEPKNGDFFNSLNVEHIKIERVWVDSDDDCFSPKSNNTDLHVDTMYCNNSHGQSLGSLGQYEGEYVFVKDVVIENIWMLNGNNGARIKVWAGEHVATGFVDNITFRNFYSANDDWPIFLDSCYFNIDAETCNRFPSKMSVSNVLFENFSGISSGSKGRAVARVSCSTNEEGRCQNIRFKNFNVTSPCGGEPVVICDGLDGDLGVPCVPFDSPEAKAALADKCTGSKATIAPPWDVRDYGTRN
ncbi:glycosyl hydrolase family 28 (exopolygalacturonase) [Colletotrichum sojae]|uniref:galacturonan 1,4-alpha-galacturonidase n=1 Tax=Colletotrichum sojae TaxID=2175907 RepID=A0A8H6IQZ1_9PEZI|nr:glycosyl hydrolase family 28 (exopolygalacturonase) [Colletotrichum sojae]